MSGQSPSSLLIENIAFETVRLDPAGQVIQRISGQARQAVEDLGQGVRLELVAVPRGSFQMGSHTEGGYADERPPHPVFLDGFWMGRAPITQAQWKAVMGRLPACRFHTPTLPVESICWQEAQTFCEKLSQKTGRRYELPSEAQWEYACRAGTGTPFSFGETITTDVANYVGDHTYRDAPKGIYRHGPTPGSTFPPNPWGLYDMHGNVWEFCKDVWTDDYIGAPADGSPHTSGHSSSPAPESIAFSQSLPSIPWRKPPPRHGPEAARVARGGSWHETPLHCRSAMRLRVAENERLEYYGLRVLLQETTLPA